MDPGGRDQITQLDPEIDPLAWTLAELRRDLASYLKRAELEADFTAPPAAIAAALESVERSMRDR